MNLLIFEYATAMGVKDPSLTAEGQAMLEGLIRDLEGYDASFLTSRNSDPVFGGKCNRLEIAEDLDDWINDNIHNYDFCLPVAPEEDFILYKLTRLIEEKGVEVVGSSSDAVCICSDKYLTYQALKNKIPVIPTQKLYWEEVDEHAEAIPGKKVIKPADGVSCSDVQIVNSTESLKNATWKVKKSSNLPYCLLQKFVEGDSASVSLLSNGEKAIPLSLNHQNITEKNGHFDYNGGKVPFYHSKEYEAKKIAKKAVESISGLKGYVGVDLILGEEVYLVEINSRLTTPYVALRNMLKFNLGEAILKSVQGELPGKVELEGEIKFRKENNHLDLKVM
ncbi:MAG: ATP-grasp domain-containing protein [Methanobacteriaceae archaeon]|nr:ATP-grasp domain-containing protein [Methanobacteriaceae archaeon]